ncbi:MAG: sulfite exporter TauE/SafE family protein [Thermodesulfobacteriota bacterium]|nr:sulfite exporter TauE/SafE family protein [Thermodesulfobacteriota bacterium]
MPRLFQFFAKWRLSLTLGAAIVLAGTGVGLAAHEAVATGGSVTDAWWFWPCILFFFCFVLGIIAVLSGVGGGVLYVPLVSGFFPFHIDFVRGAGLMVALAGALAAGPGLLRQNMASLRLAIPVALIASACSIVGAMLGLYLSSLNPDIVQVALGSTIMAIAVLLIVSKNSEKPVVEKQDAVGLALGIQGLYKDASSGELIDWKTHRTAIGLFLFIFIGLLAGMFGLGAGWANIPVLNLVMGAPLKISVATSKFLLSITDTSAAWIYLNNGCVIPLMAIPSIIGLMLGSFVGVRLLAIAKPTFIRYMVIGVLLFAGFKAIDKGLGLNLIG